MYSAKIVRNHINSCSSKSMKTVASRKALANKLCGLTKYNNLEEMFLFVQEMRGLDFYQSEDRAIFCDFFFTWMVEDTNESSYA